MQRRQEPVPANIDPREFARRLHRLMVDKGFTQSALAKAAFGERKDHRGVTIPAKRDQISAYVKGKRVPNAENLMALARALDVKMSELVPDSVKAPVDRDSQPWQITRQPDGRIFISMQYAFDAKSAAELIAVLVKTTTQQDATA